MQYCTLECILNPFGWMKVYVLTCVFKASSPRVRFWIWCSPEMVQIGRPDASSRSLKVVHCPERTQYFKLFASSDWIDHWELLVVALQSVLTGTLISALTNGMELERTILISHACFSEDMHAWIEACKVVGGSMIIFVNVKPSRNWDANLCSWIRQCWFRYEEGPDLWKR